MKSPEGDVHFSVDKNNDDDNDDENFDEDDDDNDDNGLLSVLTLRRRLTHSVHTACYHSSVYICTVAPCFGTV